MFGNTFTVVSILLMFVIKYACLLSEEYYPRKLANYLRLFSLCLTTNIIYLR